MIRRVLALVAGLAALPCLVGCATALIWAVDIDVEKNRRRRVVEIPDRMVHEPEVPLSLTGLEIDAHETLGKQVVSGSVATVVVGRGGLNRQVRQPEIFVDADLRPYAGVAVDRP